MQSLLLILYSSIFLTSTYYFSLHAITPFSTKFVYLSDSHIPSCSQCCFLPFYYIFSFSSSTTPTHATTFPPPLYAEFAFLSPSFLPMRPLSFEWLCCGRLVVGCGRLFAAAVPRLSAPLPQHSSAPQHATAGERAGAIRCETAGLPSPRA